LRPGRAGPPSARGAREAPAGPWVEPGEVEPALLLPGPDRLDPAFPDRLERAVAGGRVAALLLDPAAAPAETKAELFSACLERCRAASVALFLVEDAAAVIAYAADGLLLRSVAAIEPARRLLGLERPIGVATGGSRHAAMEAGEAGADWLLLGEGLALARCAELVGWWSGLFVLPCAAPCASPEAAPVLLAAGADFLIPPASIWADPEAALAPFRAALARPRR